MKKVILLLLLANSLFNSSAQWNSINLGTSEDLYSIRYFSNNEIWIGSYNLIFKSNNGGSSWSSITPIVDPINSTITSEFHDFAKTGTLSVIGTGNFFWGNNEYILRTTNGGLNWDYATSNSTAPLPRYILSIDNFGSTLIAVGNSGRMFRSTDNGITWNFINSGITTNALYDVKFLSTDTVLVGAPGIMLRSVNAGLNWNITQITTTVRSISFAEGVIYGAPQFGPSLIKSIDFGSTYNDVPVPFNAIGAIYALNSDTVIVAGDDGLYISNNGGINWEKFILTNYQAVNMIDFTSNEGIAVGDNGFMLHTTNIHLAPTQPISIFTTVSNYICLNDTLIPINNTPNLPNYSFQWQIDGVTISTDHSPILPIVLQGQQVVSLIVSNGTSSDTSYKTIFVLGHDINNFTISASEDSICPGSIVSITIMNSQIGTTYQMREGYNNIGNIINGNGNNIKLTTPVINTTQIFNVLATRINACFTDSIIEYKTITSLPTFAGPVNACTPGSNQCQGVGITNFSLGNINLNSSGGLANYFNFSSCFQTDLILGNTYSISISTLSPTGENVRVWIDYDNNGIFDENNEVVIVGFANPTFIGSITIPSVTIFNQLIRLRVASSPNNFTSSCSNFSICMEVEDYTVSILPAPFVPTSAFSFSSVINCPVNVNFTNASYNALNYFWDFGDGTAITTDAHPVHDYDSTGIYTVTLIACNPTGCDTAFQTITITLPISPVATTCLPTLINCTGPVITWFQQLPPGNPILSFANSPNHDFSCIYQMEFIKDSVYQCAFGSNGQTGYLIKMFDGNMDGDFSIPYESLSSGYTGTGGAPGSGITTVYFPMWAPDSVPLRMRLGASSNLPNDYCGTFCGDYRDIMVYLSTPPLSVSFSAGQTAKCLLNDSVSINFNNFSKGDTAWLWDFGDGTTSTLEKPVHFYHNTGIFTVKLTAWGPNGQIDSLIKANYIQINPIVPVITFNNGQFLASGVGTFQWLINGNPISGANFNTYTPIVSGIYSVNVIFPGLCTTASLPFSYFPVWPGDTDNNNVVNVYDLLPIGLHYNQTGPPRDSIDISWYGFPANDWGLAQTSGADIKHIDCNGDGVIDFNDTTAISTNFNLIHQKINPSENKIVSTDPDIYFITSNNTYIAGDWIEVGIMVGTASLPVTNLYGLGFDITFDNLLIEPGTASLEFSNSWLTDAGINGLSISNIDEANGLASGSVVRINQVGKSGFGKIGTFMFKVNSNISTAQSMSFSIINFSAVNPLGNNLNLNVFSHNININPQGTTVVEIPDKGFLSVYPNPFSNYITLFYFLRKDSDITIEVCNNHGQNLNLITNIKQLKGSYEIIINEDLYNLKAGIYFLKLTIDGASVVKKIVKIIN